MQDTEQADKQYSNKDLEQRRTWYSPAAEAYNKARPHYPKALINRVVELTQLTDNARILEIGCGPGTATVAFAEFDFSMVCLEPNPDFCTIAQKNCAEYPKVKIQNTSFEEWTLEVGRFDAVVAATSIHWIRPEVAYPKIANALQNNGALILLWNVPAISSREVHQIFQDVYQVHAPSLLKYKGKETHEAELKKLEQIFTNSGQFKDIVFEQIVWETAYSVDEYLTLLSTFSQYLELNEKSRDDLCEGLRKKIDKNFAGRLQLSNLSAFHIARKK
ncbi:putative methyltransferase [Acaryochloris thomasi RCC1774]|uniref:Putative methyltransferase n=1 Tax=Acaryochloris thomasi RCC1774 TaxID=1764569 RepID=A0A2W1JIC4_9CYAN|nr:class I SAM-dependent methyltransferase [Acaryochloris thomasi]PZD73263.1 putative methyltransferase [Acaryochloris thomasi RCC1774]